MELRHAALRLLQASTIEEKMALRHEKWTFSTIKTIANDLPPEPPGLPGRPPWPVLVDPARVPHRPPGTVAGRAALIHAICHIEFNAINLALDAIWRFDGMPEAFYLDWLRVAREETEHFTLLRDHLRSLRDPAAPADAPPWDYGSFVAHDGLWQMCEKTRGDPIARMALVPRTLEARGLDATPLIQARLRKIATPDAQAACAILDTILRDEIGHVAIGNRWYRWLCERDGLEPQAHARQLARQYGAPRLKAPFNTAARLQAGFTQAELDDLAQAAAPAPAPVGPSAPQTA